MCLCSLCCMFVRFHKATPLRLSKYGPKIGKIKYMNHFVHSILLRTTSNRHVVSSVVVMLLKPTCCHAQIFLGADSAVMTDQKPSEMCGSGESDVSVQKSPFHGLSINLANGMRLPRLTLQRMLLFLFHHQSAHISIQLKRPNANIPCTLDGYASTFRSPYGACG